MTQLSFLYPFVHPRKSGRWGKKRGSPGKANASTTQDSGEKKEVGGSEVGASDVGGSDLSQTATSVSSLPMLGKPLHTIYH